MLGRFKKKKHKNFVYEEKSGENCTFPLLPSHSHCLFLILTACFLKTQIPSQMWNLKYDTNELIYETERYSQP